MLGVVHRRVDHPDRELVATRSKGGTRVQLKGGKGHVVGAQVSTVEVYLGQVGDRSEAKGPVAGGLRQIERRAVPRHTIQFHKALGFPHRRDLDGNGLQLSELFERSVAGEEGPGAVQRGRSGVVEM